MTFNYEIISLVLNLVFGGGFLVTFITLKAERKKANAEALTAEAMAEGNELDNVEKAIKIWREMAENLKCELAESRSKFEEVNSQVIELKKAVDRLNFTNRKIIKLLDKISPENLENMVLEIKKEIDNAATH